MASFELDKGPHSEVLGDVEWDCIYSAVAHMREQSATDLYLGNIATEDRPLLELRRAHLTRTLNKLRYILDKRGQTPPDRRS